MVTRDPQFIKSCFNYTGGKHKLLKQILPRFPQRINTFVDLFCGGANVALNVYSDKEIVCIDKQKEVIRLFNTLRELDTLEVFRIIELIISDFGLSNTFEHGYLAYECNSSDGLSSFNLEKYMKLRYEYNSRKRDSAYYDLMFFVLTVYGFNNQIRFNKAGEFNIPVGKRDFNENIRTNVKNVINHLKGKNIKFLAMDFRSLNMQKLQEGDFLYADPPYLISTATYNEGNGWTIDDEKDLLELLSELNDKSIKFALSNVLEHKGYKNNLLLEWANGNENLVVSYLDYGYSNSNYQSKQKQSKTVEVLITNYVPD